MTTLIESQAKIESEIESNSFAPKSFGTGFSNHVRGRSNTSLFSHQSENASFPVQFPWAWNTYLNGTSDRWIPHAARIELDAPKFLQNAPKHIQRSLKEMLGYLAYTYHLSESSPVKQFSEFISNFECRLVLTQQVYENALFYTSCLYMAEALGWDLDECIKMAQTNRGEWGLTALEASLTCAQPGTCLAAEGPEQFLLALGSYYGVQQSMFFSVGWAVFTSPNFANEYPNIAQQFSQMIRIQNRQVQFGLAMTRQLKAEYPYLWTMSAHEELDQILHVAHVLEAQWADHCLSSENFGISTAQIDQYLKYQTDMVLKGWGLAPIHKAVHPFPWEPFGW